MSIIWQKTAGSDKYEVRTAGNSMRLYRNGVLHTQYNPRRPVSGNLWDLLLIPAFFHEPDTIRRVLVLGVGGVQTVHAGLQPVEHELARGVGEHHRPAARADRRLAQPDAVDVGDRAVEPRPTFEDEPHRLTLPGGLDTDGRLGRLVARRPRVDDDLVCACEGDTSCYGGPVAARGVGEADERHVGPRPQRRAERSRTSRCPHGPYGRVQQRRDESDVEARDREKVLASFYQCEETFSGNVAGAGLGLPIVGEIVCRAGGRIELFDAQPQGTVVRLVFEPTSQRPGS